MFFFFKFVVLVYSAFVLNWVKSKKTGNDQSVIENVLFCIVLLAFLYSLFFASLVGCALCF